MSQRQSEANQAILFKLLNRKAQVFQSQLAETAHVLGDGWNEDLAGFEVDVYFLFLLSCSMLAHKQVMEGWEDTVLLGSQIIAKFHPSIAQSTEGIEDLVAARVERYGADRNKGIAAGEYDLHKTLSALTVNVINSAYGGNALAHGPLLIVGSVKRSELEISLQSLSKLVALPFLCCLKHVFQQGNDYRALSTDTLLRAIDAGESEAEEYLRENCLGHPTQETKGKSPHPIRSSRRWWQIWRTRDR